MTDIKPFYITILLQAINNMYDAGCSIAKKKQVFQVNLLQGITFLLALIDLISAVCFLGNPQLQSVASSKGVILLSCIFVGFILLLLYREIFVHLSIIYRREKYSASNKDNPLKVGDTIQIAGQEVEILVYIVFWQLLL